MCYVNTKLMRHKRGLSLWNSGKKSSVRGQTWRGTFPYKASSALPRMPYNFEWSSLTNPSGSPKEKRLGGKRWTAVPILGDGSSSYHKQDTIYEVHSYYRMCKKKTLRKPIQKNSLFFVVRV